MEVAKIPELLRERGDVVLVQSQSLQTMQLTQLGRDRVQAVAIEIEFLKVGELVERELGRKGRGDVDGERMKEGMMRDGGQLEDTGGEGRESETERWVQKRGGKKIQ